MAKKNKGKRHINLIGHFQKSNVTDGILDGNNNSKLSDREKQILQYFSYGFTTVELSKEIFISAHTIDTHRQSIIRKMNVRNLSHAIAEAMRNKLII